MDRDNEDLVTTNHRELNRVLATHFITHESILYFGNWESIWNRDQNCRRSNTQYNAFEFSFRGSTVRWRGAKDENHGFADIYIDGEFQGTVDSYSPSPQADVVKFEAGGLSNHRIHTLRVVVRKDGHPDAIDCYQDVSSIQSAEPVSYPLEIARAMASEYEQIQDETKPYLKPEDWSPVVNAANVPEAGVALADGVLKDTFNRNIAYLNHCFASPTYCDGIGWSRWLPASNEGRMLAGAGNALRWEERSDMREIIDTIVSAIEGRMRDDGYYNYYKEERSYALDGGEGSERKNYDRVFWTRGLLAAGMAGNPKAHHLLRRMYDWFNRSPYLPRMLHGGNATNGLPGGPLTYLSPVGKEEDLLVTERYYDQDYWMDALTSREPLCLSYYPGERPHCYDLLGFEAFVDEYRATGAQKYIDAAAGAWDIYIESFKHVGGATAICEDNLSSPAVAPYPPKSYYLTTGHTGELCGSVFWINVNSKLLQLYPDEEKYASEIEESLYNVVIASQDRKGYKRYHSRLHGTKEKPVCANTCCEVSSTGQIARLPELIYSICEDGLYINLFAPSEITWSQDGGDVTLCTRTRFPFNPAVSMAIYTPTPKLMNIRIRIPSWAMGEMKVVVGGTEALSGTPGSYLSLKRTWSEGDTVDFTLPMGFRTMKYTGLDQIEGNYDRYALMYGPVLMALVGDLEGPGGVPQIPVAPEDLPGLLTPGEGDPLTHHIQGYPGYRYIPYWQIDRESFTCFPILQS